MRLTLTDLVVAIILFILGTGPSLLLRQSHPEASFLSAPLGLVLLLLGGSWIYRRFGILPMLLPRCPHCLAREEFVPVDRRGARWRMICASCRGAFVYWTSPPSPEYSAGPLTEVQVVFPYQVGLTREIWSGAATVDRPPERTGRSYSAEMNSSRGPIAIKKIASVLVGPARVVRTEEEITVSASIVYARVRPETIRIEVDESDCALTNALAALQLRGWLHALQKDFGPMSIRWSRNGEI